MISNRNQCKQWFITVPQCGKMGVMEFLLKCWTEKQLKEYAGVIETHDDGGKHIHVNVKLTYGVKKRDLLSKFEKIFPDGYKKIKIDSTRQSCEGARDGYLSKEALKEEVVCKFELKETKKAKAIKKIEHMKEIMGSESEWLCWLVESGMIDKV